MNKTLMAAIVAGVAALLGCIMLVVMYFSISNSEIRLRAAIVAKQRDNESELDNLKKKISQSVQVTDMQKQMLIDVVVGNAQARKGGSGTLATLVREAVPVVDVKVFTNLMNLIAGSRDSFTMRQKEILDMKREHDSMRLTFPGSVVLSGRPEIQVTIVTSAAAKEAFRTGEDNDTKLK